MSEKKVKYEAVTNEAILQAIKELQSHVIESEKTTEFGDRRGQSRCAGNQRV